ncbi:MAG: phage major capsid protein [Pseudonocardiaceae bacterium]
MNVKQEYDQTLSAARALATKAEGREFTEQEQLVAAELQRKVFELEPRVKQAEQDAAVKAAIAELGGAIGLGASSKTDSSGRPVEQKNEPAKVDSKAVQMPEWAMKGRPRTGWVKSTMDRIEKIQTATGGKALVSGSIDVAQPIAPDIIHIAQAPARLLDLLVERQRIDGTNTFEFVRQSTRTNSAAPVADNATKPTSVYTVAEVESRVVVLAHLSEALPERLLADHRNLETFLTSEMEEGLQRVLEEQIVSGSGTGENLTGLLNTSGILTQSWNTDLINTLRKAITAMEVIGETPTAWAMHPADVEVLDMLADNEARHFWDGPQRQLTTAPLWSLPVVKSTAIPTGTAVLGDWKHLRLVVRQDATLDFDRSGVLFQKNQFQARLEGRYGVAVLRPSAFCTVDLTV